MYNVFDKGEKEKEKPIVLLLVGAPGSGKSTFCDYVMRSSARPWVRVCQVSLSVSPVICIARFL